MTRKEWLVHATQRLEATSFSARLDSELLLSFCLNTNRTHLLASVEQPLTVEQETTLRTLLTRRIKHEPIAYITGHKEFYGRDFLITPDVLIPRPETELLVERALEQISPEDTVVDIGAGAGVIAVTLKCERPASTVIATEISESALDVAKKNSEYHGCAITFVETDIMDGIETPDIVVANLPYVTETQETSPATRFEPPVALFSGKDGLNHYRQLFEQLKGLSERPRVLLCEADPRQRRPLEQAAHDAGYRLKYHHKLIYEFILAR